MNSLGLIIKLVVIGALLIGVPLQTQADAIDTLHLRNPLPTPDAVLSIGFGDGKFIAGDSRGDVFTSLDGSEWAYSGHAGAILRRFAYGAGRYVAYSLRDLLSSDDGAVWTVRASLPYNFTDVAYGNGRFVAASADRVLTSLDGVSWTSNSCGCRISYLAFGAGIFVGVGIGGNTILSSPDGATWLPHTLGPLYATGRYVTYGNGKFVVSGGYSPSTSIYVPGMWHSTDGLDWIKISGNPSGDSSTFGNGTFLAWTLHSPSIQTSQDGLMWVTNALPPNVSLGDIAAGNGLFVSVRQSAPAAVARSSNGTQWTGVAIPTAPRDFVTSAGAYGAGRYVLAGDGYMVSSSDGINFARNTNASVQSVTSVIFAGGQFIGVGEGGAVLKSTDGLNWSSSSSGTLKTLRAVAYGAGVYVAVGEDGVIRRSSNGLLWSGPYSGTDYPLYGVAFAGGKFVTVGWNGIVLTSADGIDWEPQVNPDFSTLFQVIHAEGRFLAVGTDGAVVTSADGTVWVRNASGTGGTLRTVTYAGGLYVAVSRPTGTYVNGVLLDDGQVFTSVDGVTWQERIQPGFGKIHEAIFLNNTLLMLGHGGTIMQSDPLAAIILNLARHQANGEWEMKVFCDEIGAALSLQSCTNLASNWSDITSFTQTQSTVKIVLPATMPEPNCFFRVVKP